MSEVEKDTQDKNPNVYGTAKMHIGFSKIFALVILTVVFFLSCNSASGSEANNTESATKPYERRTFQPNSEEAEYHPTEQTTQADFSLYRELSSRLDIVVGFILGLVGAAFGVLFKEYLLKRRRRREFRNGMLAELRQLLPLLLGEMFLLDGEMTVEKLKFMYNAFNEYNLFGIFKPLERNSSFERLVKRAQTDKVLGQFARIINLQFQNKQNVHSRVRLIHCDFIQNTISSIALLKKTEKILLLSILRKVNVLNEEISHLDFYYKESFDPELSAENREILEHNEKTSWQFIADNSYETAQLIMNLLKK